jgi:hypothetical protein
VIEYYDDFVAFATSMGEKMYPKDLVQELFIHINNRKVTKSYCLTWLQWRILDLHRTKKKIQKVELSEVKEIYTNDLPYEVDILKDVHWFHKGVFNIWADGNSIRKISKETNISARTIQHSIDIIKKTWQEENKRKQA